jgi:hypothetical protein
MADPIVTLSFEEALGRIAKDTAAGGKPNNAKLYGGATWAEGKVGGAIAFDGENDVAILKSSKDLNLSGPIKERTISMWFNADDVNSEREQVLFEEGGLTGSGLNMYVEDGLLQFGSWSGAENDFAGEWVSTDKIESGKWHHVALTLDASAGGESMEAQGMLTAYLDGELVGQTTASPLMRHFDPVGLGNVAQTTRFEDGYGFCANSGLAGSIDEVNVFNDALNADQVRQLSIA